MFQARTQTLFAATDVGIFYRKPYDASMTQWECFSTGMPVGIVTDLDINDCQNLLYACIDSRGVYKTPIPFPEVSPTNQWEGDLLVTGNQEWNTVRYFDGDIMLAPGATLRIKKNVYFKPSSSIIVMHNSELFLESTLSTIGFCGSEMWDGIQIRGNANMPQLPLYQGSVRTLTGAKIENAKIGIATYGIDHNNNDEYIQDSQGGIIIIDDCQFLNCKVGIDIRDYTYTNTNTAYKPQIINSLFSINPEFYDIAPIETPIHIQILNNNEVSISNCEFSASGVETLINLPNLSLLPIGIKTWYSTTSIKSSKFGLLSYAIHAMDILSANRWIDIDNNRFDFCVNGAYLNAITNASVNRNEFYFEQNILNADDVVQVYFDQCPTFTVEENYFKLWRKINYPNHNNFGIIINDCGSNNNVVYKNEFYFGVYPILAQGKNRDATGNNGLSLKCNTFFVTTNAGVVTAQAARLNPEDGIAKNHGSSLFDPAAPAGNIFQIDFGTCIHTHFWNFPDISKTITYYYHTGSGSYDRHKPGYAGIFEDKVRGLSLEENEIYWDESISCPSNFASGGDELKQKLANAGNEVATLDNNLKTWVDDGDTEQLNAEIVNSDNNEGFELRNQLLSTSPFLSDTVLSTATQKEEALSNPLIRDVLVANPQSAKNETVLASIENRTNPMPEYMKQQIINGQTIIGAKESLEAQLQNSKAEYSTAFNHILAHYTHDTINNYNDSILYLLSQSQNMESRYQLAGIYLQNNETTAANQVLNSIASDFTLDSEDAYELEKLQDYYQILANVKSNNRSIYEITETEKVEILQLSSDTVNLASAWARNLLIYLGEKEYQAPIYLPEFENKSALITEPFDINIPKEEYAEINMYPNPARDYIICEYDIKIAYQSADLVITETSTGKRLNNIVIEQKEDSKTIDLKSFKSGSYIITLKIDGKAINNTTFNIIK